MGLDPQLLADFRNRLKRSRDANPHAWDSSRRLIAQAGARDMLKRLASAVESSSLPLPLREALLTGLRGGNAERIQDLPAQVLKECTGLTPTKAVRALCVEFGLTTDQAPSVPVSSMTPAEIERFVRDCRNPYDLLVASDVASLLDLGAGDLSFACELVEQYLPRLDQQEKRLTLHCIDRLQPGSSLGGILHAEEGRLEKLRQWTSPHLEFKFWGDQDMFELEQLKNIWPRYTMVTCHAPATPTFAYEPTRVSPSIIEQHLRRTKGEYRIVRAGGERALEVLHGGRELLFPPWKFEVRGPLALLDLLSRRGKLCVLSAVDTEVFWEVLSQLVADPAARPPDVLLSPALVAEQFGALYARLSELQPGEACMLSEEAPLRQDMPRVLGTSGAGATPYRFRYAEVRRGTVFEGMPASRTARQFTSMKEEATPWLLLLVPDTAHQ
ncbi:hypothetical protein MYX04_11940 [Nitrospiraceae bacterium AH_259_D15_M11_P09]|nr:hypothetical protein [Nitrospiraceae bacterium AH_259_D15_M11_P09]